MKHVMQTLKRMGVFLSCTALALTMAGPAGLYVRAAEQPPEGIEKTSDAPDSENPDPDVTGSLLYTPPDGISSSPCTGPPPVPPDEAPPDGLLPEPDAAPPDGLLPGPDEVFPDGLLPEPDAVPPDGLSPDEPDEEGFFASVRTNTYFSVS